MSGVRFFRGRAGAIKARRACGGTLCRVEAGSKAWKTGMRWAVIPRLAKEVAA